MPDEIVIDASVAAKCFLTEGGSNAARMLAKSGATLIAPDLVLIELASVAAKRVRRSDIPADVGALMVARSQALFDELLPTPPLLARAYLLASRYPLSLYDSIYLALAELRQIALVTADLRLIREATTANLARYIRPLDPA